MYPRTVMTGQMFLVGKLAPLFLVREIGADMFHVVVMSETCGQIIGKSDILKPFPSVGKAVEWAYDFAEY